jgi:TonB family protein
MNPNLSSEMAVALFPGSRWLQVTQGLVGLASAASILVALALLRAPREAEPAPQIEIARLVSLPSDEPPPPVQEQTPADPGPIVEPTRMEIAPEAASAIHLQVPDVPLLGSETPPPARAVVAGRFSVGGSVTRPMQEDDLSARRVYSYEEVDQRPMVVYRVKPNVLTWVVRNMATPRVVLLLVVNTDGSAGDVRIMRSSGESYFDQAIVDAIENWRFSPAIRKGRKVRCWVEQGISVKVDGGNPFEVH